MNKLEEFDVKGKRVLVRCDFNVPLEKGTILEDHRIRAVLPTIEYLREKGSKVILLSHLGRPEGKKIKELSLEPIFKKLKEWFGDNISFLNDCIGSSVEKRTKELKEGEILLLENVQFYSGEKSNNINYAEELSKNGDIFVLEAFGQAHREYASIVGIQKFLPSCLGMLFNKELDVLEKLNNPERPYIAIIGGVKIDTKIGMIKNMIEKADYVLIGGKIANVLLSAKGITIGRSLPSEETIKAIEEIDLTSSKIHLPLDVLVSSDTSEDVCIRKAAPGAVRQNEDIFDIGPETIEKFSEIIKTAKTIIINGPLGFFEDKRFVRGTKEVLKAVADNKEAFTVIGGGNTADAVFSLGLEDRFDFISTGGGSMLKLLGGEKLPGIEIFKKN